MQLNKLTSKIEIWLPAKAVPEIVIIKPKHLKKIQVKE